MTVSTCVFMARKQYCCQHCACVSQCSESSSGAGDGGNGHVKRVVIPAVLRQHWQISSGDTLLARLEDDRLVLEKPAQVMQRVKQRYAALLGQASLADELIAERRAAATQEDVA
jgi:bifunctional DNA-binding transcriptional regulator/antitoxin component of YhaV-PrlF toxin-antitoxin module